MKIRTKLRFSYLVWLLGGILHILLILYVSKWFLVTFLVLFFGIALYTISLKCPNCKKPVINNPIHIFGMEIWLTTPWMPKKCSKCGNDFERIF
jgi:type IV secretory pathway TrbD component